MPDASDTFSTANNMATLQTEFPGISCPKHAGNYQHAQLPQWQECCVEFSKLMHPGQPHYGSTDSVCTEITTTSVFVQILVASGEQCAARRAVLIH